MIAITQREVKRDRKLDPTEFLGETEANPIKKKSEKEQSAREKENKERVESQKPKEERK